jgi:PBP1b-binding outer membrane lipoprotein LpoB
MKTERVTGLCLAMLLLLASCSKQDKEAGKGQGEPNAASTTVAPPKTILPVVPKKKTLAEILAGLTTKDTIADLNLSH